MAQFEENCEISESDELGRYLVAKRDLPRGQQILVEQPIVIGPYWDSEICCLNCFRNSCTICRKCKRAPLCFDCTDHDECECEFYRSSGLDINFLFDHFNVVTPVRGVLLAQSNRAKFDEMMGMEAHLSARRNTDIWNAHERKIVQPLVESKAFAKMENPSLTGELIQQICGFFDVNAFEIRGQMDDQGMQIDNMVRGLYPKAALMAHNCVSNTLISVDGNANLRLYTTVPVKKGEMLQYNYTRSLFGTFERRAHLKLGKYFVCKCSRCEDPTELGTHLSSLYCTGCDGGLCSYFANEDKWMCNNCHQQLGGDYVKQVFVAARKEAMMCSVDIDELERIIAKHSTTLNPRNSVVLELKQILAGELRNLCLSSHASNVPKQLLQRKFELCEEMLEVLRILEPGISRLNGIALYEYNVALWDLSRKNFESKEVNTKTLLENLAKAETGLKESISMLLFEHPTTPEGQLTKRALRDLKELREELAQVQEMVIEDEKEHDFKGHNQNSNKKR
ncbi:SET domain-containing protein SmydA-8-like [Ochlerotatus camptorhynchus]|uniref:SET domain-containing protein SmydA-8-like n=1 Tax=Ochlerotatus camptorhynchus TaxID=644619 RepID=UPI0031E22E4D